jgi:hypothetical protein
MIYQASPPLPPAEVATLPAQNTPITAPDKNSANPAYKTARHTVATPIPPETTPSAEFSTNGLEEWELSAEGISDEEAEVLPNTTATTFAEVLLTDEIAETSDESEDLLTKQLNKCTDDTTATTSASLATSEESADLLTKQLVKCKQVKAPSEVTTTSENSAKPDNLVALSAEQPTQTEFQLINTQASIEFFLPDRTTPDNSAVPEQKPPQSSTQYKVKAPTKVAAKTPDNKTKPKSSVQREKTTTPVKVATSETDSRKLKQPSPLKAQTTKVEVGNIGDATKTQEDLADFLTKQSPQGQISTASAPVTIATRTPEDLATFVAKQRSQTVTAVSEVVTNDTSKTADDFGTFLAKQALQENHDITIASSETAINSDDLAPFLTKQPPHSSVSQKVANVPAEVPTSSNTTKKSEDLGAFLTKQSPHSQVTQKTASNTTSASTQKPVKTQPSQVQPQKEGVDVSTNILNVDNGSRITFTQTASSNLEDLLLGVIINRREVGNLDVVRQGNTLLLPLEEFAKLAGLTVEIKDSKIKLTTPLGVISLVENDIQNIKGITYISDAVIREKLSSKIEFNSLDLALIIDLPWGNNSTGYSSQAVNLQPDVFAPTNGFSNFRQELNIVNNSGDVSLQSSTLLGGRLAGGLWRVRVNNNFENSPDLSEYFYYKRNGGFLYQVGRQQIGINPLLNSLNLTGAQFGYTNIPTDRFSQNNSANELLPRRSRPLQTFQGVAPPASFVQLRVSGVVVAQQQVGFDGRYEFIDVNLPVGQNNQIEVLIFERNNLSVPSEIRSVRINSSDLLLPAGGNVQLAGVGLTGNLAQNTLFDDNSIDAGQFAGFYQVRQGLSNNLTFEGSLQAIPNALQSQAGLVWRVANPVVLSASVGNSFGKLAYNTDLDIQLGKLDITANSQSYPTGYRNGKNSGEFLNHSAEVSYRFNNNFQLGFLARSRKSGSDSNEYISPTFSLRPFSGLYLSGRPDITGQYLFNAFYQVNRAARLSLNTFGDRYTTNLNYDFNRRYQLSLGSDFGGDFATRYTATFNHNPSDIRRLSWRLGLAYSEGNFGPIAGASMQVLPGLFARVEYQGIPLAGRRNNFGGFGDDRLTISLVSDLSFAGGRAVPSNFSSVGKDRGAIAGRITFQGENQSYDLSGASVRVMNNHNKAVGGGITDSSGNFFVGNLPEGVYRVEVDPEQLPVELTLPKTSRVAEVGMAGVTNLDFAARLEYGLAGRITDVAGQPMPDVRVELVNLAGTEVLSAMTDEFGLYRVDGVPTGNYTLQVPPQEAITNSSTLPKREVTIRNEFVYDQNLQLPISTAAKEIKQK